MAYKKDKDGYSNVREGEWTYFKRKYFHTRCCKCGLKHQLEFKLKKDILGRAKILFRGWLE